MKKIITQITIRMVEKILQKIEEEGINKIGEMAEKIMENLKEGALEMLKETMEGMNKAIVDATEKRKADGITIKKREVERTPKEIHIFADEDHVYMRTKRSTIVPLITESR